MTILGANAGVAGSSAGRTTESIIQGGIRIDADGVTIDGFHIENGDTILGEAGVGVYVRADNVTIANSVFEGSGSGLAVVTAMDNAGQVTISGNSMTGWHAGTYLNPGAIGTVTGNVYTETRSVSLLMIRTVFPSRGTRSRATCLSRWVSLLGALRSILRIFREQHFHRQPRQWRGVRIRGGRRPELRLVRCCRRD